MDELTDSLEFESMLLGRYALISRRGIGRLDRSAYVVLSRLRGEGPMSIGGLSDALGLDPSTLNRQTAAMVRAGLLERIPDPEGGVARKFRLTDKGASDLESERTASVASLDEILTGWAPEDIANLVGCLERFNTAIEQYHGRRWPRPGTGSGPAEGSGAS